MCGPELFLPLILAANVPIFKAQLGCVDYEVYDTDVFVIPLLEVIK